MIHTITEPIKAAIQAMPLFFSSGLDTRIAGIVTPVTKVDPKTGTRFVFPISCDVDGLACWEQGRYFELLPNDLYAAVLYFEQLTDVRFEGYLDSKDKTMIYRADLRLVGWLNLKKFGATDCTITSRLALGIIKALTATKGESSRTSGRLSVIDSAYDSAIVEVEPVRQVRQDASIFSRYTIKESNLLYPYDYFAIDCACTLHVGRECFDQITVATEIEC